MDTLDYIFFVYLFIYIYLSIYIYICRHSPTYILRRIATTVGYTTIKQTCLILIFPNTLWQFDIVMPNDPFVDDLLGGSFTPRIVTG